MHKEHRYKNDADAERGNESRDRDLLRAIENRLAGLFAFLQIAVHVFDFDRRVIDEDAYRERQTSQRHDVDGLVDRAEGADRNQNRERYGNGDNQRAAPASEEDEDHHPRQAGRDNRLPDNAVDRRTDENRLIRQRLDLEFFRQRGFQLREQFIHARHHAESGSVAIFQNRKQRTAQPIQTDDV